jgi:hypothetical protein
MVTLKVRFRVQGLGFRRVGAIGAVLSRFLFLLQMNFCLSLSGLFSMRQGDLWIRTGGMFNSKDYLHCGSCLMFAGKHHMHTHAHTHTHLHTGAVASEGTVSPQPRSPSPDLPRFEAELQADSQQSVVILSNLDLQE